MQDWTSPMDQYSSNIRLQRNNAQNVTAKSFDELFWMTPFFDDLSREESKRRNVVDEGEEAVANWVERLVVRIVCMIVFIP